IQHHKVVPTPSSPAETPIPVSCSKATRPHLVRLNGPCGHKPDYRADPDSHPGPARSTVSGAPTSRRLDVGVDLVAASVSGRDRSSPGGPGLPPRGGAGLLTSRDLGGNGRELGPPYEILDRPEIRNRPDLLGAHPGRGCVALQAGCLSGMAGR